MAHRGRLSTIAHVVNRPYEELLAEFESAATREASPNTSDDEDATGDVKYHHGAHGEYYTPVGTKVTVELASNPSHLEAVDGVVEGMTRALQTDHQGQPADRSTRKSPRRSSSTAMPRRRARDRRRGAQPAGARGYVTGGTIHIISNNPGRLHDGSGEARSTRYASDFGEGLRSADRARQRRRRRRVDRGRASGNRLPPQVRRDVVVDLIGYRRFGHNEQDEPAYTQPI